VQPQSLGTARPRRHEPARSMQLKPRAYTIKQASLMIGIGRSMLYLMISQGRLRTVTIGRRRLVLSESIDELLQSSSKA
jgi:excisionase family DNA binding protein